MRVVLAPDKFAGTLTSAAAADAMAAGWHRTAPGDELDVAPMADGGPGFLDVLAAALGGDRRPVAATGPLGEPVTAEVLVVEGDGERTAYVESAQVCGPTGTAVRRPWEATTAGLAPLLHAALRAGPSLVVVGVGGTLTTDGGRGVVQALGEWPDPVALVAATDVEAPLLGPAGAARGYARQKGADEQLVPGLEDRLAEWAAVTGGDTGFAGAGAGGGLGYGLALLGARRVSGAALVADALGLSGRIAAAGLVVTGEGRLDWSSLRGKVVAEVAGRSVAGSRPCVVLAGEVQVGSREAGAVGIDEAHAVADLLGSGEAALADPWGGLAQLAARVAIEWSRQG